jgi:hypothetical protein
MNLIALMNSGAGQLPDIDTSQLTAAPVVEFEWIDGSVTSVQ